VEIGDLTPNKINRGRIDLVSTGRRSGGVDSGTSTASREAAPSGRERRKGSQEYPMVVLIPGDRRSVFVVDETDGGADC
jgi:hypothetical protein